MMNEEPEVGTRVKAIEADIAWGVKAGEEGVVTGHMSNSHTGEFVHVSFDKDTNSSLPMMANNLRAVVDKVRVIDLTLWDKFYIETPEIVFTVTGFKPSKRNKRFNEIKVKVTLSDGDKSIKGKIRFYTSAKVYPVV